MKPNLLSFSIVAIFLFSLLSCKKGSNPVTASKPHDVYIVGFDNNEAVYWKNGVESILSTSPLPVSASLTSGFATGISMSGNDLFISGTVSTYNNVGIAVYWKNGIMDTLANITKDLNPDGYRISNSANAIFATSNDIYIGGSQSISQKGAVVWKNGAPSVFGSPSGEIYSIYVANGDIYSTGQDQLKNGTFIASYYKNGSRVVLSDTTYGEAQSNDIRVSGSDIYAAGYTPVYPDWHAAYWKNGTLKILSSNPSEGSTIYISGNDVYVAGHELLNGNSVATIWKNGIATHLTSPESNSYCYQVIVSDNDVYAIGCTFPPSILTPKAMFWKNGVATELSQTQSSTNAMYIK